MPVSLPNPEQASPSIWATLLMAVTLILIPQVLFSFIFAAYGRVTNISNVSDWLGSIDVQIMVMFFATPLTVLLVILFTRTFGTFKRCWHETCCYLGIKSCSRKEVISWVLISCVIWGVMSALGVIANLPAEDFMLMVRDSKTSPLLIVLVICIFAPIAEELVFRGFLFRRFQQTWLAHSGAAVVTCLLFTLIHGGQYSAVGLLFIFMIAMYLTIIRWKTQNTSLSIVAHATNNTLSTIALYTVS